MHLNEHNETFDPRALRNKSHGILQAFGFACIYINESEIK